MAEGDAELAETAADLIEENGRAMTVRYVTDGSPADPAKPWNPGLPTEEDVDAFGVFLDSRKSLVTGELIPEDQTVCLVKALAVEPTPKCVLVDGSDVWRVKSVATLKPGDTTFIHELRLQR